MSVNKETLVKLLKTTPYPVFRDKALKGTDYPYIIYSLVSKGKKSAASKTYRKMPYYQISLFTAGVETDLDPIEDLFSENRIPYKEFQGIQGDENDKRITNFFTYVRCVERAE